LQNNATNRQNGCKIIVKNLENPYNTRILTIFKAASFLSTRLKKSIAIAMDFFICVRRTQHHLRACTQHHLSVSSTSLPPCAAQMNDVALCANDVLRNDVTLRVNDVALRANGFCPTACIPTPTVL